MAGAEPLPPLRVREADGSPNVIPVFDIIVSGATLTRQRAGVVQLLIDSGAAGAPVGAAYVTYQADPTLTAERILTSGTGLTVASDGTNFFVSLSTPVVVSSGGTGQNALGAFAILYGSGASAVQSIPTMNSGQLIVGSGVNMRPHVMGAGAAGQYLVTTAGPVGGLAWIDTFSAAGFSRPLVVDSGGTGQTTLTAFGVLYGSGASAIQALPTMASGQIVVGSGTNFRPHVLGAGAAGQYLVTTAGPVGGLAWINTAGGGPVYAPTGGVYLTYAPDADLTAERILIAGTGISVASDGTNFFTSVNTNVRDKLFGFFAAGTASSTMRAASAAIYVPFNMQLLQARVAMGISASNFITLQLVQYNGAMTASTALMAAANTIRVGSLLAIGSDTGTFDIGTLYTGSHLGYQVVSTGAATFGQDMTLAVICRTS